MQNEDKVNLFEHTPIPRAVAKLAVPVSYTHLTLPTIRLV